MTNYLPPIWLLIQKLDHNSGLHAKKNQTDISKNEDRTLPPLPLYGNVDIPLLFFPGGGAPLFTTE